VVGGAVGAAGGLLIKVQSDSKISLKNDKYVIKVDTSKNPIVKEIALIV